MINMHEILRNIQGMQQSSTLTRNPTTQELDTFIERCKKEHDLNDIMLYNEIVLKIQPQEGMTTMNSFVELEIYPMVLKRLETLIQGV